MIGIDGVPERLVTDPASRARWDTDPAVRWPGTR
jgi:hypothetical protein